MLPTDQADANSFAGLQIVADVATSIGQLSLRRRRSLALERDAFEMLLDGRLVMSSAVTESEQALADSALLLLPKQPLRVLVGGLGFGFTALAALSDPRVAEVTVVEQLEPVIDWHRQAALPWSVRLAADTRVRLLHDDFFTLIPRLAQSQDQYDAILVDIDDSPCALWSPQHAHFYGAAGLHAVRRLLAPWGVFALWCASRPEGDFVEVARGVFRTVSVAEVRFMNPCFRREESNYILSATMSEQREQAPGEEK